MIDGRDERLVFAAAAELLATGRRLDALSRALTVLAFSALLVPLLRPLPGLTWCLALAASVLGLVQLYWGARVELDSALFRELADGAGDLSALDSALQRLGLLPAGKCGRPLGDRLTGARGLLVRQAASAATQAMFLSVAGATCL